MKSPKVKMVSSHRILLVLFLSIANLTVSMSAQHIQGYVFDKKNGEILFRVRLKIAGADTIYYSDSLGKFQIPIQNVIKDNRLVVSLDGYKTQALKIKNIGRDKTPNDPIEIFLLPVKPSKRTNEISSKVKLDEDILNSKNFGNILETLKGMVTGLNVNNYSSTDFNIRGRSSFNSTGSLPIVVIDGTILPLSDNILNTLNPSDIEKIEILKDADATAIYGSRGTNGVIVIATKK